MLFHTNKVSFDLGVSQKELAEKYFTFSTLAIKDEGFVRILHPCLANKARSKDFRSQNPNPPIFLGAQSLRQLTHLIPFDPSLFPHQNFVIMDVMSSHTHLGSLKQLIAYVWQALATAFIRTSFSALDKSLSFHPLTFFQTLSRILAKIYFFDSPPPPVTQVLSMLIRFCHTQAILNYLCVSTKNNHTFI